MENMNSIRLQTLEDNFRNSKRANKGYKNLYKLINKNENQKLIRLLRNHLDDPIRTKKEVRFRDNIDFLMAYYTIISVGIIAGYLPEELNEKNRLEALDILAMSPIKTYYEEHYKLILPQLLLKILQGEIKIDKKSHTNNNILFERFMLLLYSRMEDDDIDLFLWLLDDGIEFDDSINDYINIRDLILSLDDVDVFTGIFHSPKDQNVLLKKAINGFSKFISYLNEYADLLNNTQDDTLRSAFWHSEAYWFNHLKDNFAESLNRCLNNIYHIIETGYYTDINDLIFLNNGIPLDNDKVSSEDLEYWRKDSKKYINESLDNVKYLFDKHIGKEIINMLYGGQNLGLQLQ